jgi:predicted transglutaminase-like cysteine proteinase
VPRGQQTRSLRLLSRSWAGKECDGRDGDTNNFIQLRIGSAISEILDWFLLQIERTNLAALQKLCANGDPNKTGRGHMSAGAKAILKRSAAAAAMALALLGCPSASTAQSPPLFSAVGAETRAPIGWIQFCVEYDPECKTRRSAPRDIVLTPQVWKDLVRVNRWVNDNVRPITDLEHWGVVERWNYPDDGYGDCEDYVLEKRRLLMRAGWPREALLITVVRDPHNDGHAVLTVKTDKGEFVLDNQRDDILLWSETGYRFVKRQSQADPNVWVSLGEPREEPATASSR